MGETVADGCSTNPSGQQENTDTGDNDSDDGIDSIAVMVVSLTILGLLLFDVFARLVFEASTVRSAEIASTDHAQDCQVFFRSFWNWFDLIVIIASIVGEVRARSTHC